MWSEAEGLHGSGLPCIGRDDGRRLMEEVEEMYTRKLVLKHVKTKPRSEIAAASQDEKTCGSSMTSFRKSRPTLRRRWLVSRTMTQLNYLGTRGSGEGLRRR